MYKRNSLRWLKHLDFILWDAFALQLSFVLAYAARQGGNLPYATVTYRTLAIMLVLIDFLIADFFDTMHNVLKRGYYLEAVETLKHVFLVLVVVTLYMFALQIGDAYSRITVFCTSGFHLIIGYGIRLAWKPAVRRMGKNSEKASMILVADEQAIPEILSHMDPSDFLKYTGLVLINRDGTGEKIAGVPVVASLQTAADYICREWVDEVFISPSSLDDIEVNKSSLTKNAETFINKGNSASAFSEHNEDAVGEPEGGTVGALIEACRQMAIPVHIRIAISNLGNKSFVEKVGGYNVITTTTNYVDPIQLALKRAMDLMGGIVGSLIALVVIAVFAPAIKKESPGPILFKQTRIGHNGKKFKIYKLRSMYLDAEKRKAELMDHNRVSDGMMFKLDWDPRIIGNKIVDGKQVTGIGEKMRAGSWDEWPQFFNVLMGQMSLVGTRPPTVDEWEKYKYRHRARLSTKPGVTGMWQVSGRSKITDFEEVVKLDTEYISHWNIALDIRILLKTVKVVFQKEGAM